MRFSLDIPDELADAMRIAAANEHCHSVSEWARQTLAIAAGVEVETKKRGGARKPKRRPVGRSPKSKARDTPSAKRVKNAGFRNLTLGAVQEDGEVINAAWPISADDPDDEVTYEDVNE